jgi:Dyp-type peroxidase family
LLLSSEGYEFLDVSRPKDGSFRDGMRDRGEKLNDPKPNTWENEYRKHAHALLIIADNTVANLTQRVKEIESQLAEFGAEILVAEWGHQQLLDGKAIEHFGYRDGVSQPKLIVPNNGSPGPDVKFDQRTPLKRVLEEDRSAEGKFGSYAVYRKLEQDVDSFEKAVADVATQLNVPIDYVGAQAVGRFKNGTPLALSGAAMVPYDASGEGKFDYDDDKKGRKCPLHAHIRKTNPRNSLGFIVDLFAREKKRRIARRGITYGNRPGKVGLIFICYQSDIKDQFEFIQRKWANSHNFSRRGTGLDPVIGQDGGPQEDNDHPKWRIKYNSKGRRRLGFGEHVRLRGGEYFFAPSIEGLKKLGTGA